MGLFDSRKEQKSIKLVKKLQEQADLEWEKEVTRRREQELNDEAIAKELQAQLQDESTRPTTPPTTTAVTPPTTTTTMTATNSSSASLPPPLPTKPRAYNSSISLVSTAHGNNSTSSIPTSSLLPKPLYGLQSSSSSQPSLPPRHQNMSASPTLPSQKPVKSYLSSLQFSITSPTPAPNSVFYQNTPALAPAKPTVATSQQQNNTPPVRPVAPSTHMSMPEPIDTSTSSYTSIVSNHNRPTSPISSTMHQRASAPTIPVASAYPPTYPNYSRQNSTPISLPLSSNDIASNGPYSHNTSPVQQNYNHITTPPPQQQQSYNNVPSTHHNYNNVPPTQQNYSNAPSTQQSYTPLPPLQSSYYNTSQQNYNGTPSAPPPSYNDQPSYHHTEPSYSTPTYGSSLPTQPSSVSTPLPPVSQSVHYYSSPTVPTMGSMPWNNQSSSTLTSIPLNNQSTSTLTSMPLKNQSSSTVSSKPLNQQQQQQQTSTTNPYFKKHPPKPVFSNSIMTLKPDEEGADEAEEEDEWDTLNPVSKRPPTPPAPAPTSDDESEYDYSDMIYDRRESDPESSDPFADTFAVKATKKSTIEPAAVATVEILDPTIVKRQLSTKIAVEPTSEIRVYEEKKSQEVVEIRKYEEKESEEIEPRFQTPIQHARPALLTSMESTPVFQQQPTPAPTPVFFSPPVVEKDVNATVYPTNILRAGAPPMMSANNPYNKKQQAVPASDYGYYEENNNSKGSKILPKLPESTAKEDRHITVASVNPEQRVWIRIQPTDTGKMLAERIHVVASYQTRRVTKITTKNGRNIPLDNSPLFDDWNEIISFKEGEAWSVDWVPVESPYVDILTEGKDLMKFLKANFKSSSHKDK